MQFETVNVLAEAVNQEGIFYIYDGHKMGVTNCNMLVDPSLKIDLDSHHNFNPL